jgi:hypothetical protein
MTRRKTTRGRGRYAEKFKGGNHLENLGVDGRIILKLKNAVFCRLQPPAQAGSTHADFSNLKMEVILSSETSVHTRSTRHHIPEDVILLSHRRENLKSYTMLKLMVDINETVWTRLTL